MSLSDTISAVRKRHFALPVDFALQIWQRIPGPISHNLAKARILRLIFWHLAVDQKPGFYIEFGVAFGHSMKSALLANKFAKSSQLRVPKMERYFFGVDTFEGFKSQNSIDSHPVWNSDAFTKSLQVVKRRFRRFRRVDFFKIDATAFGREDDSEIFRLKKCLNGRTAAIVLFDMDLYEPTARALEWIAPYLQEGTFLLFDEFFAFGGSMERGEVLALQEFIAKHPNWILRDFASYGAGGKCFVLSKKPSQLNSH